MAAEEKEIQKYILDFEKFEHNMNGQKSAPVHKIRKEALRAFQQLGFPGPKDEEWRFTNVSPIIQTDFKPVMKPDTERVSKKDVARAGLSDLTGPRLVFVDGFFAPHLSHQQPQEDGLQIMTMGRLMESNNYEMFEHIADFEHHRQDVFTALNSAFINDGLVIHANDGVVSEQPVHILFISTKHEQPQVQFPRLYVYAGKNSRLILVEHYMGMAEAEYFTNAVLEMKLEENASVDHYKIQNETPQSYHIGNTFVYQDANTSYDGHAVTVGASLSRHNIYARLDGENSTALLNGLYMGHQKQHQDSHLCVDHTAAHCNSHQIYRGILADKAHGVFSGKILVRQDAQKTDADQSNDALLLSDKAQINSKPQLEIYADDVRCTHGATIGELHDEAVFYMMSRGLSRQQAKNVLTYAFASQVIDSIKVDKIKSYVGTMLNQRLKEDMDFSK